MLVGVDAINIEQYKIILKKVWASQKADPDQLERLKMLRATLNISEELHQQLEQEIMKQSKEERSTFKIAPSEINILIKESKIKKPAYEEAHQEKLKDVKLKKYLTLAKEKYLKGDYGEALELLKSGSKLEPENEEIKFYTKKVKLKLKRLKKLGTAEDEMDISDHLEIRETVDERTGVKIKEKIATPRFKQKKLTTKSAIPVDNLNGASLNPHDLDLVENMQVNNTEKPLKEELKPEQKIEEPARETTITKSEHGKECEQESEHGHSKFNLEKPEKPKCISCNGTGKCYWCSGSGECDRCGGTGNYNDNTCTMCHGSGKCNSCNGEGNCMWCKGKGTSKLMNTLYTKS